MNVTPLTKQGQQLHIYMNNVAVVSPALLLVLFILVQT